MRIKFIKIEEGKVKAANKALKRQFLAKKGHETEGFKGTYEYAAKKQVTHGPRVGGDEGDPRSTQAGVKAGKVALGRAASGEAGKGAPRGSNRAARRLAHAETKSGQNDPKFQARLARRRARQNASTEIFGNKIVEGFNRLLNEGGVSDWLAQGAKKALTHAGDVASSNISRGLPKIKQGIKTGAGWLAKKAMYGAGKLTGMALKGGKSLWKKYAKENSSTEILGNKIVEGFDNLLNKK